MQARLRHKVDRQKDRPGPPLPEPEQPEDQRLNQLAKWNLTVKKRCREMNSIRKKITVCLMATVVAALVLVGVSKML